MVSHSFKSRGRKILYDRYLNAYRQPIAYASAICLKCDKQPIGYIHTDSKNDSFSPVTARNQKLEKIQEDKQLYSCVFMDGNGRYGYCIFQYHEDESAFSNWEVKETTPYAYDLRANEELIADSLMKTDINLLTTVASRVCLYNEEKKSAEQAVLFMDGKKNYHICYYGDAVLKTEKWEIP